MNYGSDIEKEIQTTKLQILAHASGKSEKAAFLQCSSCSNEPSSYSCNKSALDKNLSGNMYLLKDHKSYCESCYEANFALTCANCGLKILEDQYISAFGKQYHKDHFRCANCKIKLESTRYYDYDAEAYCIDCYRSHAKRCYLCGQEILDFLCSDVNGSFWHRTCWKCGICGKLFEELNYTIDTNGLNLPVHIDCYKKWHYNTCFICNDYCDEEYYELEDNKFAHPACLQEFQKHETQNKTQEHELYTEKDINVSKEVSKFDSSMMLDLDILISNNLLGKSIPYPQEIIQFQKLNDIKKNSLQSERSLLYFEETKTNPFESTLEKLSKGPRQSTIAERIRDPDSSPDVGSLVLDVNNGVSKSNNKWPDGIENAAQAKTQVCYPYQRLISRPLPLDVDISRKEEYLSDQEFESIFCMTKESFYKLSKSKQFEYKIKAKLF